MTGTQRILAALSGQWPDKVPVLLHNFLLAAREAGVPMSRYRRDPRAIADCHIRAVETYAYDGILIDVDTAMLAGAVGVPVDYPDHDPARCKAPLLHSLDAIDDLPTDVDVRNHPPVAAALEACTLLAHHFRGEICIRGNCDQAPFSLASMIRCPEQWMLDLMDEPPEKVHRLLEYCTGITSQFLRAMSDAGAHVLSNGDSPAGPDLISPALYREFALPHQRRLADLARSLGKPYVLHVCGNTSAILLDLASTGATALELDYKTDPATARDALAPHDVTFIGNLDPTNTLAHGTPALVASQTRALLETFSTTPRFILNAGCAIPPTTPPENLRAMISTARAFR